MAPALRPCQFLPAKLEWLRKLPGKPLGPKLHHTLEHTQESKLQALAELPLTCGDAKELVGDRGEALRHAESEHTTKQSTANFVGTRRIPLDPSAGEQL